MSVVLQNTKSKSPISALKSTALLAIKAAEGGPRCAVFSCGRVTSRPLSS